MAIRVYINGLNLDTCFHLTKWMFLHLDEHPYASKYAVMSKQEMCNIVGKILTDNQHSKDNGQWEEMKKTFEDDLFAALLTLLKKDFIVNDFMKLIMKPVYIALGCFKMMDGNYLIDVVEICENKKGPRSRPDAIMCLKRFWEKVWEDRDRWDSFPHAPDDLYSVNASPGNGLPQLVGKLGDRVVIKGRLMG